MALRHAKATLSGFTPRDCAERLRVLADETRLAILQALTIHPWHVTEMATALHVERSLLSHHLRILRQADLVEAVRDGKSMLYRITPGAIVSDPNPAINIGCCHIVFHEACDSKRI